MFRRNAAHDVQNNTVLYQKTIGFIKTEEISHLTQMSLEVKTALFFYRLTTVALNEMSQDYYRNRE
jgi:hypothetical protein